MSIYKNLNTSQDDMIIGDYVTLALGIILFTMMLFLLLFAITPYAENSSKIYESEYEYTFEYNGEVNKLILDYRVTYDRCLRKAENDKRDYMRLVDAGEYDAV